VKKKAQTSIGKEKKENAHLVVRVESVTEVHEPHERATQNNVKTTTTKTEQKYKLI
jgi:hypothetical protein